MGKGLAGAIWNVRKTYCWDNLLEDKEFLHSSGVELLNLNTALGIPIIYNKEFLGCLICFSQLKKNQLSDQIKLLSEIGLQMGPVIKQKIIEEQYRNFFNISPYPQCILGFDGYLKKFNNAFNKILGYERTELINKPFFHFLHQDDKAKYKKRFKASIQGANSKSFEARFLTKTGEVKWLIWNGTVIPEGKIIIAAAKDITEQKIAEKQLITAYERLRTAQKIAKLGYWRRNLDSDLSEWSEETYSIYGYTPANFVPTLENVTQTFHPDDRYLIEDAARDKLEPGKVKSFENRIITSSNEVKWVRQEIRLLANDKNIPYRIEGTIQDITVKKEYELQLTMSNERFKMAMQASNEMIWEIDHENKIIIRSKGYDKTIHYDTSEPFKKDNSWFKKVYPDDLEDVWKSLQNALQNKKETYWSKEYRMLNEDGSTAYFIDRCFIVRDEKGFPLRSVGCALDVTASKRHLERIKLQNKNLREIAWLQSHVIRAPLTRIMGLIYLVKEHNSGDKSIEEIFDMISDSADELDNVIHKIIYKTDTLKENGLKNFDD
jgi:PAS domain S-box-containing protein